MASTLTLNQTLHGYNEGHRLLAASIELPPRSERLIHELSDLSGDGFYSGFEEYLTAYPLPERNQKLYAFARTWYASEMERPGCVWTHTLIINIEDFKFITDVNVLLELFSRPHKGG